MDSFEVRRMLIIVSNIFIIELILNYKLNAILLEVIKMKFYRPKPHTGDTREIRKFAWYPMRINDKIGRAHV